MFLDISQNSQENTCVRVSFLIKLQAWGRLQTLAQVFSFEFYEISKNTFFREHGWTIASAGKNVNLQLLQTHFLVSKLLQLLCYESRML